MRAYVLKLALTALARALSASVPPRLCVPSRQIEGQARCRRLRVARSCCWLYLRRPARWGAGVGALQSGYMQVHHDVYCIHHKVQEGHCYNSARRSRARSAGALLRGPAARVSEGARSVCAAPVRGHTCSTRMRTHIQQEDMSRNWHQTFCLNETNKHLLPVAPLYLSVEIPRSSKSRVWSTFNWPETADFYMWSPPPPFTVKWMVL